MKSEISPVRHVTPPVEGSAKKHKSKVLAD